MRTMLVGVVGKSNVGKTTFFSAATLVDAEISNRIFTTIEPNRGVSYARVDCVCRSMGVKCSPQDGKCVNGIRFVPVKMVDVAGLVPGAHEGRGLGNKFLSDAMEADVLIHVVDASGSTDMDGNPVAAGAWDPRKDAELLPKEIDHWMLDVLKRNWGAAKAGFIDHASKQFSGLKMDAETVKAAAEETNTTVHSDDAGLLRFVSVLRERTKPMVTAANKIDMPSAEQNREIGIPASAESELALRKASEAGLIKYTPGDSGFEITGEPNARQLSALAAIRKNVLAKYGSTGVQACINAAVMDALRMIVVYPVENEHKLTDGKGNVLPNALLMKKGSTPRDLAYRIHKDIGDSFAMAIDAKAGRRVAADYELRSGDIISVKAR